MEELLARVDALGRRPTSKGQVDFLTVADFTLDGSPIEQLRAVLRPVRDVFLDHQRAGDLAGLANASERLLDEIEDLAWP